MTLINPGLMTLINDTLLQEAGLVHHQHPAFIPQMLHHVVLQVITYEIGIPPVGRQQSLHPVGRGVAS